MQKTKMALDGQRSATNLAETAIQARLRDKLHAESVKLWLEPFYDEVEKVTKESEIMALASRYATELEHSEEEIMEGLLYLQNNAIERLAERDLFKTTGLSTVRVKYSGFQSDNINSEGAQRMQLKLGETTGLNLKETIASIVETAPERLKIICSGRVIKDHEILEAQNVKNGSQIMVLAIVVDKDKHQENENQFKMLEEAKENADYLAGKDRSDDFSLQIADQTGAVIELPEAERKALAVALALHEKGRSALRDQDYSKALIFLLEAESKYGECHSDLLDRVDNFGLLNLDVAWCYLCLESISELPSIEARLQKCEKALERSYGENMERVASIKGAIGWEAALSVRLHLLQSIAAYHLGQVEKSKFYLRKVDSEISRLKVSDDKLADLVNMGYSTKEARMALRATFGNTTEAVDWIIRKREEDEKVKSNEKETRRNRRLQKLLGLCENGDPVNFNAFKSLKEMGFNQALVCEALKRANNDVNSALQFVNDEIFITSVINEAIKKKTERQTETSSDEPGPSTAVPPVAEDGIQGLVENLLGHSFSKELLEEDEKRNEKERERSQKAYENLTKDIQSDEEYIDLNLTAETDYLVKYKSLLNL